MIFLDTISEKIHQTINTDSFVYTQKWYFVIFVKCLKSFGRLEVATTQAKSTCVD